MARWAIGDVQGCCDELEQHCCSASASRRDRDQLWFVGDLVNRGPYSLNTLRLVRSLGQSALCVLGNHDLHLLAVAIAGAKLRKNDTLSEVLSAPDRDALLEWLLHLPLAHLSSRITEICWCTQASCHSGASAQTILLAREVEQHAATPIRARCCPPCTAMSPIIGSRDVERDGSAAVHDQCADAIAILHSRWSGRLQTKGQTGIGAQTADTLVQGAAARNCRTKDRVRPLVGAGHLPGAPCLLALDTGCVWGGALTAANLDDPAIPFVSVPSRQPRSIEA